MQSKKLFIAFFIIGLIFYGWPKASLAQSRHYTSEELISAGEYSPPDGKINFSWPAGQYSSLDFYFQESSNAYPDQIQAISPIYYYSLISEEVKADDELLITYQTDDASGLLAAYFLTKDGYQVMPVKKTGSQSISFSLKGRGNRFFIGKLSAITSTEHLIQGPGNFINLKLPAVLNKEKITTIVTPLDNLPAQKKQIGLAYQITFVPEDNKTLPEIIKAAKESSACQDLLSSPINSIAKNKIADVKKLQQFLREQEGFLNVQINGKYDKITIEAIKNFQEKYTGEILKPWALKEGTGQVQKTTLKKINSLNCQTVRKNQSLLKISASYGQTTALAKNWHYFDENNSTWKALPSLDDHKQQQVIAYIEPANLTIALFEETDQWVGEASWYAWKGGLFAASRDFPKGTKIRVTNQSDGSNKGKSVIVTINDYGPEAWTKRLIDLDKVAYQQIGSLGGGVMPVKIEVVK